MNLALCILHPFPLQRANAVKREPELQAFWDEERIYERLLEDNTGDKYVLHDGPPYANGDLHIGHALNKVETTRLATVVITPHVAHVLPLVRTKNCL